MGDFHGADASTNVKPCIHHIRGSMSKVLLRVAADSPGTLLFIFQVLPQITPEAVIVVTDPPAMPMLEIELIVNDRLSRSKVF